jgi:hypothetical protein
MIYHKLEIDVRKEEKFWIHFEEDDVDRDNKGGLKIVSVGNYGGLIYYPVKRLHKDEKKDKIYTKEEVLEILKEVMRKENKKTIEESDILPSLKGRGF